MVDVLFPSFCISINLQNLHVCQKKNNRDLAHKNYLKLKEELDASYDMIEAFEKLGLKDKLIKLKSENEILFNKIGKAIHEYDDLKTVHITAVKEQTKMMVLLLGVMPQLKTPELREKEKLMKASAMKIVLMKEENKLNLQEIERLDEIIYTLSFISPFIRNNEGQAAEYKRKEYDDAYCVLQEKISEAEDAYAVAEEEIYQLLVKIFIY
jgi:hypothetical protein